MNDNNIGDVLPNTWPGRILPPPIGYHSSPCLPAKPISVGGILRQGEQDHIIIVSLQDYHDDIVLLGCWCIMVDVQRWLSLGPGGTSTQEASSSLPHLPTLCLFLLPLHWSIAQFHCTLGNNFTTKLNTITYTQIFYSWSDVCANVNCLLKIDFISCSLSFWIRLLVTSKLSWSLDPSHSSNSRYGSAHCGPTHSLRHLLLLLAHVTSLPFALLLLSTNY